MKLAARLILVFLAGVLAIVGLFEWQTIRRQQAWEAERRATHAQDLVSAIEPSIKKAWDEGGTVTIQEAVEVTSRSVSGRQLRWMKHDEEPVLVETTARKSASISVTDRNGKRTAFSYVPIKIDGEQVGTVEVSEPTAGHDAHVQGSVRNSLVSLLGVAALSAVVVYFGGVRLVGRPLNRLIGQVGEIGEGKLDQKPVLSGDDELGRLATAISDMSHRLRDQRDTIRHTDRLGTVGTLAAGIAHELGTPLNVVSGRAALIAGGKLTAEEVASSAETIRQEADRMTVIIRQLLDFARQAGSTKEIIDIRETVTRTCDLMTTIAKKSDVSIETAIPTHPIRLDADASQIQQVLTNLISNAIGAMPDGGTIIVGLHADSSQACLSVQDTGPGIAPEYIERLFEPFVTTKDIGEGTGLGLSIAYGIVKEHGGEIKVESNPGDGTTFRVLLPYNHNTETEQQ